MNEAPGPESAKTSSPTEAKLNKFLEEFPGVFQDGSLDAHRLAERLGVEISGLTPAKERYGLNWAGRGLAAEALRAQSMASLSPIRGTDNWSEAQNVFIEGDNLEVLKLLQKPYNDKIKLIYIDPPYNTGNDFVYNDDFSDAKQHYLEVTGQVDAKGNRLIASSETRGRKHSNWMTMMYPRLTLARNLLRDDGAIFISIDDNEVTNLRMLMDDIFGPENFLAMLPTVMNLKGNNDQFGFAGTHEYTMVFARNIASFKMGSFPLEEEELEGWQEDEWGPYKIGANLKATGQNAPRAKRPNLFFPLYITADGVAFTTRQNDSDVELYPITNDQEMSWRWSKEKFDNEPHNVIVNQSENSVAVYKKQRPELGDLPSKKPKSLFYSPSYSSGNGTQQLKDLFGHESPFSHPKPLQLIQDFILLTTGGEDIVLDFFAGSGTTGHAVLEQNKKDGGRRKFILVQLNEEVEDGTPASAAGYEFISEITLKRLDLALEKYDIPKIGVRAMRLGKSSFVDTSPVLDGQFLNLFENTLDQAADDDEITLELLTKSGVQLDAEWKVVEIEGERTVISESVAVVLARKATQSLVEKCLGLNAHTVIFLEDAFAGQDAVKANAHFSFKQANIALKTF